MHPRDDVVLPGLLEGLERLVDDLLVHLVGEVVLEGAAVDVPLAGARCDADARDGFLASSGRRTWRRHGLPAWSPLDRLAGVAADLGGLVVVNRSDGLVGDRLGAGLAHKTPRC